ncbi:MAG TPA: caspase family protein, partial [Terricaulis sp.]|nr:caspase family protein [Terricaulis sp.]
GQAGQRVAIELTSTEFDAYIILRKPDGTQQDNDDDERGNNGTNSRIELTLEATGEYHVHATTFRPGETGNYRIVVTDLGAQQRETTAPPATASVGSVGNNQTINGSLANSDSTMTDGQFYDLYTFNGRRGQNVTLEVTSNNFDTYLMLIFPSGEGVEDDDGVAGTTNSRISGGLPEDGEYTVVVSSYSPRTTGNYALRMNLGAASASAPAVSTPTASAQGGRVFLLSVGISDYGGQGDLAYTADDARNLYTALQQSGSLAQGSVVLTDGQATLANVRAAFQRIAAQVGPNDLFFFFFSGHGGQEPSRQGSNELDGREEFLALRDGYLYDDEMARLFGALRSRLSIIALDACFSGGFARDVITNPRVMGLFSSDEDLTSAVAGKFQAGGYLSHFLRTGFQGEADENRDGVITAGELHSYLWRRFASEQNIGARSMDGERSYQRLVVDRGGVKIDDVVIALGR